MKKYFVVILMFLLVFALFAGCSKKAEENTERSTAAEKADAALLATALSSMTSNVEQYDTLNGGGGKGIFRGPPSPWQGPAQYTTPDGNTANWYWMKIPVADTIGMDTLLYLLMQTPDRWADSSVAFVTKVEVWLWYRIKNTTWFHFELDMDSTDTTHISGIWRWNYEDTWLEYKFTAMGTEDYSGTIDVSTSNNINLTAHFEFGVEGDGTGWGKYQGIKFVEYTFYTMPPDPYRGYYTLASEGWNIKHYF